jgi:hypothetical protein
VTRTFTAADLAHAAGLRTAEVLVVIEGSGGFVERGVVVRVDDDPDLHLRRYRATRRGLALSRGLALGEGEVRAA